MRKKNKTYIDSYNFREGGSTGVSSTLHNTLSHRSRYLKLEDCVCLYSMQEELLGLTYEHNKSQGNKT